MNIFAWRLVVATFLVFSFMPNAAFSGILADAHVVGVSCVNSYYNGTTYVSPCLVYMDKLVGSCGNSSTSTNRNAVAFNTLSNNGKSLLSVALAANAQNKIVSVQTAGTCSIFKSIWDAAEDLNSLTISPKCSVSGNAPGCTNL